VQAERYGNLQGVATESTSDEGGGRNLAHIQAGDWVEDPVEVKAAGRYRAEYRVAALSAAGRLAVLDSLGRALDTVDLPVTGGFQIWRTQSASLVLPAGRQVLRFRASQGGFNLNWIRFSPDPVVAVSRAGVRGFPAARRPEGVFLDLAGRRIGKKPQGAARGVYIPRDISALR
jgi:hypothetical protein